MSIVADIGIAGCRVVVIRRVSDAQIGGSRADSNARTAQKHTVMIPSVKVEVLLETVALNKDESNDSRL